MEHLPVRSETELLIQISTLYEAPSTITKYSTLPGSTAVVYSTIRSAYTSTVISIQPGRTIYETSISTEEGATFTATLNSVQTITVTSYSVPIGPATPPAITVTRTLPGATLTSFVTASATSCSPVGPESPQATITLTRTLPGATFTSFFTAPGYNHSSVYTSIVTLQGPTVVSTAPGARTTITEYETRTLPGATLTVPGGSVALTQYATKTLPGATYTAPGGSFTFTQYATKTLPGATITSVAYQPGENSTVTETTTCFETVSSCSATPIGPVSSPRETTVYATDYVTKVVPTTYTADATCHDVTVTITASSSGWDDKPGDYGPHTSSEGWGDKPSGYGGAHTTATGSWKRM